MESVTPLVLILIVILVFLIHILFCYWIGKYAKDTAIGFWGGFLLSLAISPFVGIIVVIVLKIARDKQNF